MTTRARWLHRHEGNGCRFSWVDGRLVVHGRMSRRDRRRLEADRRGIARLLRRRQREQQKQRDESNARQVVGMRGGPGRWQLLYADQLDGEWADTLRQACRERRVQVAG